MTIAQGATATPRGEAGEGGGIVGFPFRFGVFGGWAFTSSDADLLGEREADLIPGPGPHFGLRAGWRAFTGFGLELEAGLVPSPVARDAATAWLLPIHLQVQWRPLESSAALTPILSVGGGLVARLPGAGGSDVDLLLTASGGIELDLSSLVSLRITGGVHASDGIESTVSFSPVVSLGIDFKTFVDAYHRRGREPEPELEPELLPVRPARPSSPTLDQRPPQPGCPAGVPPERCVDSDGDRRIDAFDRCPLEPAESADGCPDPDGDGVMGLDDACPKTPGPAVYHGCPGPR